METHFERKDKVVGFLEMYLDTFMQHTIYTVPCHQFTSLTSSGNCKEIYRHLWLDGILGGVIDYFMAAK